MNPKEIVRVLNSKLKNNEIVEIFRESIDEFSMLTNIVDISSTLVQFDNISDFSMNGQKIVRLKDITSVSTCDKNESLSFINRISVKENIFSGSPKTQVNLKSFKDVFRDFVNLKIAVTVECNFEDAIDYYVGWIKSVNQNIATMQCFDGSGIMFADEVKVNIDFVSSLTFGDRYTHIMAKYVK